jgi:tRNA-dihydrouridine synthase
VTLAESVAMGGRHLRMMVELYGPKFGPVIFRKHAVRYVHHLASVGKLRTQLVHCTSIAEYDRLFAEALEISAGRQSALGKAQTGSTQ